MSDTGISDMLGSLNAQIQETGMDLEVGMEVDLPFEVSYGPVSIDTEIRVLITEDGAELVQAAAQEARITRELLEEIDRLAKQTGD